MPLCTNEEDVQSIKEKGLRVYPVWGIDYKYLISSRVLPSIEDVNPSLAWGGLVWARSKTDPTRRATSLNTKRVPAFA